MSIKVVINEPTIGLTDRTAYLSMGEMSNQSFMLQRGNRGTANLTFIIRAGDSYAPTEGAPIFLYELQIGSPATDVCVFAGTIDHIDIEWRGNLGDHFAMLSCVSLEQCFDVLTIDPPTAFFGTAWGTIITSLFGTYAAGAPVTLGTISAGSTPPAVVLDHDRFSDVLTRAANESGYIWYVDPATQKLVFRAPTTVAAPFTLTETDILWETLRWSQTRQNFRDRQVIRIAFESFALSNEIFAGDDVTTVFQLREPVAQVIGAQITSNELSTASGTFTGQPAPGDTITVNDAPYVFVTALDNTALVQVLIGANTNATAQNLVDAINRKESQAGLTFSLPTWENDACNADNLSGATFRILVKWPGAGGNGTVLAKSCANFSWSTAPTPGTTVGGSDGTIQQLNVALFGANVAADLYYLPGSPQVICTNPPPIGSGRPSFLSVAYRRLGGDCIAVEDTALVVARAAAEHGTGKYQAVMGDTSVKDAQQGLLKAQMALAAYKTLPVTFGIETDSPGLTPGDYLTVNIASPTGAGPLVNGQYVIQEVAGNLIPGADITPALGHFRYTVSVINTTEIQTYVDFWTNLAPAAAAATVKDQPRTPTVPEKIRCINPGVQVVASDVTANHYRVKIPLGAQQFALTDCLVTAEVAPGSSPAIDYVADVLRSNDDGATWDSVFASGLANKAVLPAGIVTTAFQPAFAIQTLLDGDLIRMDVLQADGVVAGIEVVLYGGIS